MHADYRQFIQYSKDGYSCLTTCSFASYDARIPTTDQVADAVDMCNWLHSHGTCPDFSPQGTPICPRSYCAVTNKFSNIDMFANFSPEFDTTKI